MEPKQGQVYASFTYIQDRIPPLPPIPDTTEVRQQEINRLKVQSEMNPPPPKDDWNGYGMNIARENLGNSIDPDDPIMSVGWREGSTARVQDSTQRWTSSPAHDQPFMWNMDYGSTYVIP